jgi:ABC-2 type transport system permease protein
MMAVVRAELLKVRTTRAVWAMLAATVALTALAVAGAVFVGGDSGVDLESEEGVALALHVAATGAVFVLVLGTIIATGEVRHGTGADTYLTTPRRRRVLTAKLAVGAGLGILFGAVSAGVAFLVADHAYQIEGHELPADSARLRSILLGSVVYAALFGALGVAIGSLVRNQVAAIAGSLAWLLVAEQIVVSVLPDLGRFLPAAAGRGLVLDPGPQLLTQAGGGAVLAGYAAGLMLVAMVVEQRRDA